MVGGPGSHRNLQIKKLIGICVAIVSLVAEFLLTALDITYVAYPRAPNPSLDRVAPYTAKGLVVYIASGQRDLLSWLNWVGVGKGVATALVILIHRGDPFLGRRIRQVRRIGAPYVCPLLPRPSPSAHPGHDFRPVQLGAAQIGERRRPASAFLRQQAVQVIDRADSDMVEGDDDVAGIFPNEAAITWRIGAIFWGKVTSVQCSVRYMSLETIAPLSDNPPASPPAVAA